MLATKVHGRMDDADPNAQGNSRRHILSQCEASLRRLQTDHIDLHQIHRPSSEVPIDETLRALDDLVRAGKVRYIGTSTYAAWQVMEALGVSRELVPLAQSYGLAILPWSPLAGGFLTGKCRRDGSPPQGSRYQEHAREGLFTEEAFRVLDLVEELASEKGCSASQLSLAWCAVQPAITSPIIGPRTLEQLEDNLGALAVELTEQERGRLDKLAPPGRVISPYYEADFGPSAYR